MCTWVEVVCCVFVFVVVMNEQSTQTQKNNAAQTDDPHQRKNVLTEANIIIHGHGVADLLAVHARRPDPVLTSHTCIVLAGPAAACGLRRLQHTCPHVSCVRRSTRRRAGAGDRRCRCLTERPRDRRRAGSEMGVDRFRPESRRVGADGPPPVRSDKHTNRHFIRGQGPGLGDPKAKGPTKNQALWSR
jgi:hypothetical protein